MPDRRKLERDFMRDEFRDSAVYARLAADEADPGAKGLLLMLSATERSHARDWQSLLKGRAKLGRDSIILKATIAEMLIVRKLFGIAFVVKYLERHERYGLAKYRTALRDPSLTRREGRHIRRIIREDAAYEATLVRQAEAYKGELVYSQSIILGLNDGLVEILALVAGIAVVATSSLMVVALGLLAGISGTLSMAGGAYLSAKSGELVVNGKSSRRTSNPRKEAAYTGLWYFIGALISVLPFIAGMTGLEGDLVAMVLVAAALAAASSVIAIMSGTSIRKRATEMVAISLGAALVTVAIGTLARYYLGFTI
jgi:VIT1/CCC1 family predicted Fe2+/Mn2+ transporter